jgi:hypothetical protein
MPLPVRGPGPSVPESDIRAVLKGIEPGWYRTRDLYPRYVAWAERQGKKAASSKSLGESIRRSLALEVSRAHGNVTRWHITEALTQQ